MYKTILLAIDMNEPSSWEKALPVALEQATSGGAKLNIMTVVPDFGMAIVGSFFPADYEKQALAGADKALGEFMKENVPAEIEVAHSVGHGTIYKEVLATAERIGADLIVMASHRPAQSDYLLGPNAARVVRHATCSVLVVRG
ncbi:MAG: universal stress protein [Alphaproteobacteria bacterium]|nr:universal stress protein [Alphaproteobacteria bacterium]